MKLIKNSTLILLCLCVFTAACTNTRRISNNFFVLPLDKKFLPLKYADTSNEFRGYYVLNTNDTVWYNVFYHVSPLFEECPEYMPTIPDDTIIDGLDTIWVISSKGYAEDRDVNRRQNVYYRFSEGLKANYKTTLPVDSNRTGFFGIFVDSFYVSPKKMPSVQMNVYVAHPQKGSYKELYNSFQKFWFIPPDKKTFILPDPHIPH